MENVDSEKSSNQASVHHDIFVDLEHNYRATHPIGWWSALVGPLVITALVLLAVFLFQGIEYVNSYLGAAMTAFVFLGRFVILLGGEEPAADAPWYAQFVEYLDAKNLCVMLTYMDVMVAMFVAFHMGIVFRIPWIGPRIADMVSDGDFILKKQPWIRRVAFIGLVCFVVFPTSTTGSVGGSIFGRLLGMRRWRVVTAILLGSILGNGLMLVFAEQISKYVQEDNWWMKIAGVMAMVVAFFLFERKFRSLKNHYLAEEEAKREEVNRGLGKNTENSAAPAAPQNDGVGQTNLDSVEQSRDEVGDNGASIKPTQASSGKEHRSESASRKA